MRTPIEYIIRVRRNSGLALLAEVTNYARLNAIPRFNDVGRWTLEIGEETAAAQYLVSKTNGIVLERNIHDGNGFVPFLSGPIDHIERAGGSAHNLLISGPDDMIVLKDRLALCNPTYPIYDSLVLSLSPLRYYRLGETSGTTAVDASGHANGTYTGGFTLGQASLIDDPDLSVLLNGTSGFISVPTAGLPTGNAVWSVYAWGYLTAYPAGEIDLWNFGTNASKQACHLGVLANGFPLVAPNSIPASIGATAVPLNTPLLLGMTWDGTTLTGYHYSTAFQGAFGSQTPGALNITYGSAQLGAQFAANFWAGRLDEGVFVSTALRAADFLRLYQTGISRYGYQYSDHQSGAAETVMKHYVNVNAGPGARPEFQTANLTIEPDQGRGNTVTVDARNEVLLEKLKEIAVAGGDLGFRVVQVGSSLQFQVYQPPDVSSNAKFSEALGNLADFAYSIDAPKANYILGGGQGEGTARAFYEQKDSASISAWGRTIVAFYDDRGATGRTTLQNDVAAQLAQDAEQTTFQAQPIDTDALQAFKDYDLGSKVSVIVNGSAVTDLIREVEITVTPDQGSVVKPGIGTVGSGQIEAILTHYQQELKRLRTLVQRLQAHS